MFNAKKIERCPYRSARFVTSLALLLCFSAGSHASDNVVKRLANQYDVSRLEFGLLMVKPQIKEEVADDLIGLVFEPGEATISSAVGVDESGIVFAAFVESIRPPDFLIGPPDSFELISDRAAKRILSDILGNFGKPHPSFSRNMGHLFSSAPELASLSGDLRFEELGSEIIDATTVIVEVRLGMKVKRFRYRADVEYDLSKVKFPDGARELVYEYP
jgi:hypothetical protein